MCCYERLDDLLEAAALTFFSWSAMAASSGFLEPPYRSAALGPPPRARSGHCRSDGWIRLPGQYRRMVDLPQPPMARRAPESRPAPSGNVVGVKRGHRLIPHLPK